MSTRRRRRRGPSPRLVGLIVGTALSLALIVLLARGVLGLLNGSRGSSSERDPMFAEEATRETRPPELDENGVPVDPDYDPSLNWTYETQTPVDMTAEELSREEAAAH